MTTEPEIRIRPAVVEDVDAIRDLFVAVYGKDYPYEDFYDTAWLTKSIYDDSVLCLVQEADGQIIATASMMLAVGGMDDLIGEAGRLVASPDPRFRGKGLFVPLVRATMTETENRVQLYLAEARTAHRGAQRIFEALDYTTAGFEPLKYRIQTRESMVLYVRTTPLAMSLRCNNPRVIPEVATLAQIVLSRSGHPVDIIVEDEIDGYPTDREFQVEHLVDQTGWSSLLRIERGRVSNKEIFGNFSLSHGFFRLDNSHTHYLVARRDDAVLGAVGYMHDAIDRKIRIFELIEFDDAVKGHLLSTVDRFAREEHEVDYIEVDVSAYSPKMQRTLERLGFVPVAYLPSMVFHQVERLDIVRMAKVCCTYDLGDFRLLDQSERIRQVVETGIEDRLVGLQIDEQTRKAALFQGLLDGDLYHLARIAHLRRHPAGTVLMREGAPASHVYLMVNGEAEVRKGDKKLGALAQGATVGEMALVEQSPRSADVVLSTDCAVIEIPIARLDALMQARPRLGYAVSRNLAKGLSAKLRDMH